ncbi:hypothetical protein BFP78_03415 [Gaetbulibacter sp. 5U11]|nr:hypothetical protein BFP78_03415 [Gaetbulibacter sp. 5U11]
MKLSKENIQFIDTYLENSEIHFADIRMEMVDHIASALEAELELSNELSFYDAFKAYMVCNKARLLQNNEDFLRNTYNNLLKLIWINMLTINSLLVFLGVIISARFIINNLGFETIEAAYISFPLLSFIVLGFVYLVVLRVFNYDRFSGVERIGFVYVFLFQVVNALHLLTKYHAESESGHWIAVGVFAISCTLIYTFVKTAVSIMINYKKEYKRLV